MKAFCAFFLCCALSINVFAETQPTKTPVSEREANINKHKNNLFQGVTPTSNEAINELRLNRTLRNRVASELYQNHLFVYHQWLHFWKQWVDSQYKEIHRLPKITYDNARSAPELDLRYNESGVSKNSTVSLETGLPSSSARRPDLEQIYPIHSDVDGEILFWISKKKLNQNLNNSIQTPTTVMVNPNFQINTITSNSTNAENGTVSPVIHSNSGNDFVVIPSHINPVVSNITNTTMYFVSPSQNTNDSDVLISFFVNPTLIFEVLKNSDPPATETLLILDTPIINVTGKPEVTTQHTPQNFTITPVTEKSPIILSTLATPVMNVTEISNVTTQQTSQNITTTPATQKPPVTLTTLVTPVINVTVIPDVITQQISQNITIGTGFVNFTSPDQKTLPVTVEHLSNQTDVDFTSPKLTTLPVTIKLDSQQNRKAFLDNDDGLTNSVFVTGTSFTPIYTTEEPLSPCNKSTCLNSTEDCTNLGPSTDDSICTVEVEDLISCKCTGNDYNNGTMGTHLEENNSTNPGYIKNNSSNYPLGSMSDEHLLNSSNFNNNDCTLNSDFFNGTNEGSGDVCYCDELEDYDCDQNSTTSENPNINVTDLNRSSENNEDSEGKSRVFVKPKSTVDIAAYVSQNPESIKSFFEPSQAEDEKFKKSLEQILEAFESAGSDPVKPEDTQDQLRFHRYDQRQLDNATHNSSLLEQVDPNIFSIIKENLDRPPHGAESPEVEQQNSTSHQQIKNVTFDLLDDSDILVEELDLFKESSSFPNPNNTFYTQDRFFENKPLVINRTVVATTENPEDLYRRHSKELVEMREIMTKLRLIGLNFLDMGHLMLNGNSKCPILPKHKEESHKYKNTYPVETN